VDKSCGIELNDLEAVGSPNGVSAWLAALGEPCNQLAIADVPNPFISELFPAIGGHG